MGTTSDKLTYLNTTKSNLKDMINYGLDNNNKIDSNTTFRNYVSSTFKAFIESLNNPNTLWGNLPKVNGEGKEITLNNTIEAPMKLELKPSELEQGENPSPTNPQQIHTISGDNEIVVSNKNLFNLNANDFPQSQYVEYNEETQTYKIKQGSASAELVRVPINIDLQIGDVISTSVICESGDFSLSGGGQISVGLYHNSPNAWIDNVDLPKNTNLQGKTYKNENFTIDKSVDNFVFFIYGSPTINTDIVFKIQIEKGSTATTYVEHKEQEKEIDLDGSNLLDLSTLVQGYYNTEANPTITGTNDGRYRSFTTALKKGTYTICFDKNANSIRAFSNYDYSAYTVLTNYNNAKSGTFTLTQDGIVYFSFRKNDGTDWDNNADLVWLVKGNEALPYEPYNSIEYCEIGDYKDKFIRNSGKNLFDYNLFETFPRYDLKTVQLTLKPNTQYTMSTNYLRSSGNIGNMFFLNSSQTANTGTNDIYAGHPHTLTTNSDGIIKIQYRDYADEYTNEATNYWYMLNEGSTALPYEPYGNGLWYIKKNIGKVVLDGTTNALTFYNVTANRSAGYIDINNLLNYTIEQASFPPKLLSTHLVSVSQNATWVEGNISMRYQDLNRIYICLSASFTGASDMNNWLSNNNVIVYYPLATSEYLPLNDTLQEQLTDIYNTMKSYNGQTLISQNNNDLAFNISSSAIEDIIG